MCGRFLFIAEKELSEIIAEVKRRLAAENIPYAAKTGEVFPTDLVPILVPKKGERAAYPAFWGFMNDLCAENVKRAKEGKKPLKPKAVFNTRAETADTNGFWRDSLHKRRCLVPTSGFYEWQHVNETEKVEHLFKLPGAEVTMIAGIWHTEHDEQIDRDMIHFSMLTTEPNSSIAHVHDRMPLVLRPEEYDRWLSEDYLSLYDRSRVELECQAV